MWKSWAINDNIKDEYFKGDSKSSYTTIEAPEIRDFVNKIDLARPMRNIFEDVQHVDNFVEQSSIYSMGNELGVIKHSLNWAFSGDTNDVMGVKVNPGGGDTYRFYARIKPGIAYINGTAVVSRPQTHIAERQIAKILQLNDWKDESVSINYFYNTDLYQAKIVQRNTSGIPTSWYFTGHYPTAPFQGDSLKWGDSRYGYRGAIKLFEAVYQGDSLGAFGQFRSYFRSALGDSLHRIVCEPYYKLPTKWTGDTVYWKISSNGRLYGDSKPPIAGEFPLQAYQFKVTNPGAIQVIPATRGDSRKFIQNSQDFNQNIYINTPQFFGDTSSYSDSNPFADSVGYPFTRVQNKNCYIIAYRQLSGKNNSAVFGYSDSIMTGVLPVRSMAWFANKDIVVSRWTNAGDTLGRAWASVMSMSGDSWNFYGDKTFKNGSVYPIEATGHFLGKATNRWKVFGDSLNLLYGITSPSFTYGTTFTTIGNQSTTVDTTIFGDTVWIGDSSGAYANAMVFNNGNFKVLGSYKYPGGGSFYTGTTNPSAATRLNYDGYLYATVFQSTSSREFKSNIKPYKQSALNIINDVKIVSFNYKEDPDKKLNIGFVAEDTHEHLSGKNKDIFDLNNTIGILLKGVQELDKKVEKLNKENLSLRKKIISIENKIKKAPTKIKQSRLTRIGKK